MTRARASNRGFTLLEVMLAFVLLSMLMGLSIAALSNGLRQVRRAQDETEATLYAQSLLDGIGVLAPVAAGVRDGRFGEGRYRYRLDIRLVSDPAPLESAAVAAVDLAVPPSLYRVALEVQWGDGGAGQRLRFATLRARTTNVMPTGTVIR